MGEPALVTGCDVVDVGRFSAVIDRRAGFLARVFTAREVEDARRSGADPGSRVERHRLAARFAAKEATRKALGDLGLPLLDVELRTTSRGAPQIWIRGERTPLSCSLSHDGGIAMAVVVGVAAPPGGDTAEEIRSTG